LLQCVAHGADGMLELFSIRANSLAMSVTDIEIFRLGINTPKIMFLLCKLVEQQKLNLTLSVQKELIELCLAESATQWLARLIDNRISISSEIEQLFSRKRFHHANRERTDLQASASIYFNSVLGPILRPFVTLKMAEYMIFSMIKYGFVETLLDAAGNTKDFLDYNIIAAEEFTYKVCRKLLRCCQQFFSPLNGILIEKYFKTVSFSQPVGKYSVCKADIKKWLDVQESLLILNQTD
jgi:hypothetical protein